MHIPNQDPANGTPGRGEEKDEDADEGNHGLDGGIVMLLRATGCDTNDSDNELADDHAGTAVDQEGPTANLLDGPKGDGSRDDVDKRRDERHEEGVVDRAELLEKGHAEVEDEVDAYLSVSGRPMQS